MRHFFPVVWPVIVLALTASVAHAHDFWIEPASHVPVAGTDLAVRLRVGDDFQGEEFPYSKRHATRFEVLTGNRATAVRGEDQQKPAGSVRVASHGLAWIVYRSSESTATVEPEKFGPYLEEEGNSAWLEDWRARDPEGRTPVREAFSRCAKSLLNVGDGPCACARCARGFGRLAGLRLEIVPQVNPLSVTPGNLLPVRLLWEGRPVADAQITARSAEAPTQPLKLRTDACGRTCFRLDRAGVWLLTSVRMEHARPGEDIAYRSTWSSLTFEMPAPRARGR